MYIVETSSPDVYIQLVASERSFYITTKTSLIVIRYWS